MKFVGKDWLLTTVSDVFGNELEKYYAVELKSNEKSEMFFSDMVPRPEDGVACLNFRYKKFLSGMFTVFSTLGGGFINIDLSSSSLEGGHSPLQVLAWPYRGRPGKVNIMRDSPDDATWIRAQVTFRKVRNFFVILFRANSPRSKKLYIALDDVSVEDGPCV